MPGSYNVYNVGDAVFLTATFKSASGDLSDPTEVQLRVKRSSGEVDALAPERQGLGVWRCVYSLVGKAHGEYRYRWEATGALIVVGEGAFYALPSSVPAVEPE